MTIQLCLESRMVFKLQRGGSECRLYLNSLGYIRNAIELNKLSQGTGSEGNAMMTISTSR